MVSFNNFGVLVIPVQITYETKPQKLRIVGVFLIIELKNNACDYVGMLTIFLCIKFHMPSCSVSYSHQAKYV